MNAKVEMSFNGSPPFVDTATSLRDAWCSKSGIPATLAPIACHCGQVKIKLTGEPVADLYCHCRDCQRITGGCVPYSIYPHVGVEITEGKTFKWALKDNPRTRCANCGTYLFGDPAGMGVHGISAYLLPPGVFKPQLHILCKEALVPVKDNLPHFAGYPASLGGSDDKVDW